MSPRVSVLVPLYNKAAYIRRCLDSILEQSWTDFELIVVNDGSSDEGPAIVGGYDDSRIRLLSQPNAGPGAARNRGAGEASGDYLAMLDGDDSWQPDYLAQAVATLDEYPVKVAGFSCGMMEYPLERSTQQRWREARMPPAGVFDAGPETPPATVVAMLANMLPSSTVMRRSVFLEMGGFYAKNKCVYAEDAYLYLKTALRYSFFFDYAPRVNRYCDASELSLNFTQVRPIEPFLSDPEELLASCPARMRRLLNQVLAIRAAKTASVYGYWGRPEIALSLVRRFLGPGDWRIPHFSTALVGCTPVAGWAGWLLRRAGRS